MEFKMITTKKNPNCIVITAQLSLGSRWCWWRQEQFQKWHFRYWVVVSTASHRSMAQHTQLCPRAPPTTGTRGSIFSDITPWRSQLDGKCSVKIHSDMFNMNVFFGSHLITLNIENQPRGHQQVPMKIIVFVLSQPTKSTNQLNCVNLC